MLLVVDSSIWVKALITNEPDHSLAHAFFADVALEKHRIVIPSTVLTEVVCASGRMLKELGIDKKIAVLWGERLLRMPNVSWKNVDRAFAYEAATCGWLHGLRGMDALLAATSILYGCPLLTNDRDFERLESAVVRLTLKDVV